MNGSDHIGGIIPAVVTPMQEDGSLDEAGLRRLIDHLIDAGVHGIFTIGTAGEFWALSHAEKEQIFRWTVEATDGRVPVYLGTCANTTSEAVDLARLAQKAGAQVLSVLTPLFIAPSEDEMLAHYSAIAAAVDLPVLLYTNPDRTGNDLSPALVERMAEIDNIAGIKDSSGNLSQAIEYLRRTPDDFHLLMGRDTLIYAALQHGASGAIAASANLAPELAVAIYERWLEGDMQGALAQQLKLVPLRQAFSLGTFPAILKTGLELLGRSAGPPRAPVGRLTEEETERLRAVLVGSGHVEALLPNDGEGSADSEQEAV
ncbi:MAG: 4-hydroxy-tetrahydrodipicolinate synthase [Gemmatimonadetes bacterium]|jgi:4-hydroxy-tetrahydrodipicolinate synthase|nr:4-hydroxy-tetrahydrodipicolinate synthase [Gemmatimonadota bacterium]MBT6146341.1 4-hydroxy-tetrahydrodipicolinate synthase [Gemmatimonadota bacterium]MBT7858917.1 4-hydroxy-tetrahydrodipicolinate synthase [Gemmatimonadota bacterium]